MKKKLLIAGLFTSFIGSSFSAYNTPTTITLDGYVWSKVVNNFFYGSSAVLDAKEEMFLGYMQNIVTLYKLAYCNNAINMKSPITGQMVHFDGSKVDWDAVAKLCIKEGLLSMMQKSADQCHYGDTTNIIFWKDCHDVGCYVGQKISQWEKAGDLIFLNVLGMYNLNVVTSSYHDKASVRLILGLY